MQGRKRCVEASFPRGWSHFVRSKECVGTPRLGVKCMYLCSYLIMTPNECNTDLFRGGNAVAQGKS